MWSHNRLADPGLPGKWLLKIEIGMLVSCVCVDVVTNSAQGRPARNVSVAANWGNFYPASARLAITPLNLLQTV